MFGFIGMFVAYLLLEWVIHNNGSSGFDILGVVLKNFRFVRWLRIEFCSRLRKVLGEFLCYQWVCSAML